jgi:hypothetical protein
MSPGPDLATRATQFVAAHSRLLRERSQPIRCGKRLLGTIAPHTPLYNAASSPALSAWPVFKPTSRNQEIAVLIRFIAFFHRFSLTSAPFSKDPLRGSSIAHKYTEAFGATTVDSRLAAPPGATRRGV